MTEKCHICGIKSADPGIAKGDATEQTCGYCGHFLITGSADAVLEHLDGPDVTRKLRGYIWSNATAEKPALINTSTIENLPRWSIPTVSERAEILLREIYKRTSYLGAKVNINERDFVGITFSKVDTEVKFLSDVLEAKGLVTIARTAGELPVALTATGYSFVEEHKRNLITDGATAFVAMWFNAQVDEAYRVGIKEAIQNCGYLPVRIDEVAHAEKIDDMILRAIQESAFVVADLTGHRGGVYFEAGYALALGKKVIWTCRETDFEEIHFDVRQYNCIKWKTESELFKLLEDRLISLFGKRN